MFTLKRKPSSLPAPDQALPGRANPIPTAASHFVSGAALKGPYPQGAMKAMFGLGCFWGAERKLWQIPGVYVDRRRLCRRAHAEPDLRGGLLRA